MASIRKISVANRAIRRIGDPAAVCNSSARFSSTYHRLQNTPIQLRTPTRSRSCSGIAHHCDGIYRYGFSSTRTQQMQYYNGNAYYSGAAHFSSASPAAQEEKTAIDRATPPIENNSESSHDENSLMQKFAYLRERNHTVGRVMSPKRTPNRNVNNVNGYKYRILKTPPQSTTNPLTIPTSTSSQIVEKEYNKDALYQNTVHNRTASTAPRQPLQSKFQSSIRNRRSSLSLEEMISSNTYNGFLPDERTNQEEEEEEENISERIKVRSVQAASSIDVVAVLSKVFGGGTWKSQSTRREADKQLLAGVNHHPLTDFFASSPPIRHVFGRTNIIIQLSPPSIDCPPSLSHSVPRYVAIYRFGSVVFFNFTTKEASLLLKQIKKHSVDPISVGFERREHFEVALQPELEAVTGNITADRAMVRELDMYTVGIVSNIMGKTVALDWHNDTVDELLANFSTVNSSVERTGGFTSMERHTLFQVVARNNSLFIEMVGKLGIKDRSDTAWHLSQYEGLHEEMRKEFDLDQRFKDIEFKLDLIQQNAKFFLEVMHAQKSNTLEWVIIVLISFECVLMIMDMSGLGEKMLAGSWFS